MWDMQNRVISIKRYDTYVRCVQSQLFMNR